MLSTHLVIGEITKPQGVNGEVKIRPITCDIDRFAGLEAAYFKRGSEYVPVSLKVTRIAADAVFMFINGISDRTAAEKLRGELLYVDREHAVELDEDTEFVCDLIGLNGIDDKGASLGTLTEVLQPGAADVYVFKSATGETMIPALKSVVLKVDHERGVMLLSADRLSEVALYNEI